MLLIWSSPTCIRIYIYAPDEHIKEKTGDRYILVRFVANKAIHDRGHIHINHQYKRKLIRALAAHATVWISSEDPLPKDLLPYKLRVRPDRIHDVIANADLVIGDGATMCSEAAMLGVPAVFINQSRLGCILELDEKYNLVHHFLPDPTGREEALNEAVMILEDPDRKTTYQARRQQMLKDKENLTDLMIEIVKKKAMEAGIPFQNVPIEKETTL